MHTTGFVQPSFAFLLLHVRPVLTLFVVPYLSHRTQSHGVEEWEPDIFKYLHDAGYYINWFGKDDGELIVLID